ncbi:MAG: trehalose-6-phosphate synthase [Chloroflexi bacterium]|nr:trehalose-6-phosphate synthase [Chloroflexota bacterium]
MAEPHDNRFEQLLALARETLEGRRLIVVSNRGPVEHRVIPNGDTQAQRGSGTLVTAFSYLMRNMEFTWVSSTMGEGDRLAWQKGEGVRIPAGLPGNRVSIRYVSPARRAYHKFYNTLCNPILWFLQHYMWSTPYTPTIDQTVHDAWDTGYVEVNKVFAEGVLAEAAAVGGPVCVMLHDYHLYLVAGFLRAALPTALIHHFVHIPWPTPTYWELLPTYMRQAICQGLCGADVAGFQTHRDGVNFLHCCEDFLPEAEVDYREQSVLLGGHRTFVKVYPTAINVEEVRRLSSSPRVRDYERQLVALPGEKAIVRVDRAEPNKNILRGLRAYETLLQRHPDLKGTMKFLAFLVPSRTHIRQYQRYVEEVQEAVKEINAAHGAPGWTPIHLYMENNYTLAVAGLRMYDVLLVNPVIDGMNLVAKEGPVVNTRDGVLLLSEAAGAYPQLAAGALAVGSADVEGTMQAMHQALLMPAEERHRRQGLLVEAMEREDVVHWFQRQFEDLRTLGKQG